MDYMQLLDQTMAVLNPAATAGPAVATNLVASALWDWLKEKFKARSAAAAEAVADVVKSPGQPANWEVLRAQLAKALAEDESFRKELAAQLDRHAPAQAVSQRASLTGDGNVVIQSTGGNVGVNH
ncbi:MAG: hypothetical protein ACYDC1_09915 [Limisphaerales bacterium]